MKIKRKLLITLFISLFCIIAFSVCTYANDIIYEYSVDNPNYHNIIINGQNVGKQPHRAETDATCMSLAICNDCKAQFGEYSPHRFLNATCTNPKTCSVCDFQEGEPIPHSGGQAKCLALAICDGCGAEYGDILGHIGGQETCSTQAVCTRCGIAYGATLPHTGGTPTCQRGAICIVCNNVYGELGECSFGGEWIIEDEFHYQLCQNEGCDEISNDSDHMDKNNDGKCDTCGAKYKLSLISVILILVIISVFIGAVTVGVIFAIKKKNKKDLI